MEQVKKIVETFNSSIREIENKYRNTNSIFEKGIVLTKNTLIELRESVLTEPFNTEEEEITFFKYIKPEIYGRAIYYCKLISIENKRPRSGVKEQIKYLKNHIKKLQVYFNENLEFYSYYRRRATYLDKHYFLRGKENLRLHPDSFHFLIDDCFSTSHDCTVATIIAYDMLIIYLKEEIDKLENSNNGNHTLYLQKQSNIVWTSQKVNLIELIYALHSTDAINNGKVDIKDIARVTERIFKIDLGDYYRAYLEIRMRKKGRTKFLDMLKENLEKRMDEIDD